jgi:hypothetical protein
MRFSEYLPAEDFIGRPSPGCSNAYEIAIELSEVLETGLSQFRCELGDDWQFNAIETAAIDLPAYRFKTRKIKDQSYQLALIAHALEETLSKRHPALSSDAVAAFWTSWSVWNHLSKWSSKISHELRRRKVHHDDSTQISRALQHQAWSYARMVGAWSIGGTQSLSKAGPHNRHGEATQSPNSIEVPVPDATRGLPTTARQATTIPLRARNLEALRCESELSRRELARRIGPGEGDPKAVRKHLSGHRLPEQRTFALYAQVFTKCLGREITSDQIRKEDLTLRITDSMA